MLKGFHKGGFRLDSRLPITLPILDQLILVAPSLVGSPYQVCQFQAMCSLAFYAFLRLGEITGYKGGSCSYPLQISQLTKLVNNSQELIAFKVTFKQYKHCYNDRPFSIVVSRQHHSSPVELLIQYLELRGTIPGPLFITVDEAPVTRSYFSNQPASAIRRCGLSPTFYKGHSFRIGAASHTADRGLSDAQIRLLGRWKSNAFLKYMRVSSFCS